MRNATQRNGRTARWVVLAAAATLVLAACRGEDGPTEPGPIIPDEGESRPVGSTDFVSADGVNGQDTQDRGASGGEDTATPDADDGFSGDREVVEGDIYRVMDGDLIANLNAYRGLQIIDFGDVANPEIIGRLQVSGSPVEMYVEGDRAFVLMNNWYGYYGSRGDVAVDTWQGGLVMAVDISDPTNPRVISRAPVPGYIQTSRMTRGSDNAALYVVAGGWAEWTTADGGSVWESRTVVRSFDAADGSLTLMSELNLGGYVADIQATTDALLVARNNWERGNNSQVAVIDISDPSGTMVEGDEVEVTGYINNQFNMDLYNHVLRIVSTDTWDSGVNVVETFDATDFNDLSPIDSVAFGAGESLFATLFLENKAFFVTYQRTDPFHTFEITDEGEIIEHAEFVVTGWNDFFRPVFDGTRLIGIGINDENGRAQAVSLYDITDLDNPNPLIDRDEVEIDWGWSEAQWDHRAFSVLQDAVHVSDEDGVIETGLVLLPYSGWDDEWDEYTTAVQIYTFSEDTLTMRGTMEQGTNVRRSFLADDETIANLGEEELSFYECSDPNAPTEVGRVDLAPNYTQYVAYDDFAVRLRSSNDWGWWGYDDARSRPSEVQVIPADGNPDAAEALASFEIPAGAQIHRVNDLLVATTMRYVDTTEWPYTYETTIDVYDLSNPASPEHTGTVTTDRIQPGYYYDYWGYGGGMVDDCFDCGGGYYYSGRSRDWIFPTDGALAFLQQHDHQGLEGVEHTCSWYPRYYDDCRWATTEGEEGDPEECVFYDGGRTCRSLDGGPEVCEGEIYECTVSAEGDWDCVEVDLDAVETEVNCYDWDRYRYWNSFSVEVVDVSNPAAPRMSTPLELPVEYEGVSAVSSGNSVYVSYKVPVEVEDDARPYVRYFFEEVDLTNPSAPRFEDPVNVPGELIAVDGDQLYTRDSLWGDEIVETGFARLELHDGLAYLQAYHRFVDQEVHQATLDGAGHVVVSHRLAWRVAYERNPDDYWNEEQHLTVLDGDTLGQLSDSTVDSWATLQDAAGGRALFTVPGGLLVFNIDNPSAPFAQAYFATMGWPSDIAIEGDEAVFAAGRYGIYAFDLDAFNLLAPL